MAPKPKPTTKAKTSTPKAVQQGNENQREGYNAVRGTNGTTPSGKKVPASKISKQTASKSNGSVVQARMDQRAGGSLNRSYNEKLISKGKEAGTAIKRNSKEVQSKASPVVQLNQKTKAKKK